MAAAATGGHLRVDAPPGTGRTQTVANLVAELVGRGRTVLVVGHRRTGLADLVARLRAVGLDDLVLDLGDERTSSSAAVRQVAEVARRVAAETADAPGDAATELGDVLQAYRDALHRPRQPFGTCAYDAMVALVSAPAEARTTAVVPVSAMRRLEAGALESIREHLREYAELGGLAVGDEQSPWHGSIVPTEEDARALAVTVAELREQGLPALRDLATRAAVEVGLAGTSDHRRVLRHRRPAELRGVHTGSFPAQRLVGTARRHGGGDGGPPVAGGARLPPRSPRSPALAAPGPRSRAPYSHPGRPGRFPRLAARGPQPAGRMARAVPRRPPAPCRCPPAGCDASGRGRRRRAAESRRIEPSDGRPGRACVCRGRRSADRPRRRRDSAGRDPPVVPAEARASPLPGSTTCSTSFTGAR